MPNTIFWQWLTLSLIVAFMGFCFCDGFKLHILRKLLWFISFLALVFLSLKTRGRFDLVLILAPSILLSIILCSYEKKIQKDKQ